MDDSSEAMVSVTVTVKIIVTLFKPEIGTILQSLLISIGRRLRQLGALRRARLLLFLRGLALTIDPCP